MFKIVKNKIYLTQGDTARFSITTPTIAGTSQSYELSDSDTVYFIVTQYPAIVKIEDLLSESESCIFYKTGRSIVIESSDTKDLDVGEYYYQVRVILSQNQDINTIIEPESFYITPEKGEY